MEPTAAQQPLPQQTGADVSGWAVKWSAVSPWVLALGPAPGTEEL